MPITWRTFMPRNNIHDITIIVVRKIGNKHHEIILGYNIKRDALKNVN